MVRRPDGRARLLDPGVGGRRTYFRLRPLNELCRNRPSDVMSRYSTSAKKVGSTHVAFGFLIGFVSLDFGLTTVSSCFLIWLETVRDQPVPTLPMYPLLPLVQMNLDPVTVELDFMEPLVAGRRLGLQHSQLGLDEPRHLRR